MSLHDAVDDLNEALVQVTLRAESRETFDLPLAAGDAPRSERLSAGSRRPSLVALPSIAALSGAHQYLDFGKYLRNNRDLFALTLPGFLAGERLPASIGVAVEAEASAVRRCVEDGPIVLVGMSAGGMLAYGVARRLEEADGPVVAGVVLLDSYPFGEDSDNTLAYSMLRRMFQERDLRRYLTETRLTAMAWYMKLLMDWKGSEVAAPTLMVRPADPMLGMSAGGEWRTQWPYPHDTVEVPGDHWTMMMEGAVSTAEVVEQWVSDTVRV
jgi:thioesterase domain-containing protein